MLNRRSFLTLGMTAAVLAPTLAANAGTTGATGWRQGNGMDALAEVLDGQKEVTEIRNILLSMPEYRHVVTCGDLYRDTAKAFPHEPERLAYSQAWDSRLQRMLVEGRLTVALKRDYAAPRWV